MFDFFLLLGILAVIGTGTCLWRAMHRVNGGGPGSSARRREDARDWQRRFIADSHFVANFLQPTQNEVLETLSVLDHLTPAWESSEQTLVESHFFNELAICFPSLRKPGCEFPLPFAGTLAAKSPSGFRMRGQFPMEESAAARREAYRAGRAQANALEQMTGGSVVGPAVITPGSLPFRVSAETSADRIGSVWPVRFAIAAVCVAATIAGLEFYHRTPDEKSRLAASAEPTISPAILPVKLVPAATEPADSAEAFAESVATVPAAPATTPETAAVPPSPAVPTPTPSAVEAPLNARVAASQQRAVGKFPALAIEGSEINLRFVFRYKNLLREKNSRLFDPDWPEQLAEECAAATLSKHNAMTRISGARR